MGGDTETSYTSGYNVVEIKVPNSSRTYRYVIASFGPSVPTESPIVLDAILGSNNGCSTLTNSSSINGKIAVVDRGDCYFATKTVNAQAAGAKLLIIINNEDGPPVGMAAPTDGSGSRGKCRPWCHRGLLGLTPPGRSALVVGRF